eukprot:scaffold137811_cov45-Attheya_sp.AAC.2
MSRHAPDVPTRISRYLILFWPACMMSTMLMFGSFVMAGLSAARSMAFGEGFTRPWGSLDTCAWGGGPLLLHQTHSLSCSSLCWM